jgi:hypothetical protein
MRTGAIIVGVLLVLIGGTFAGQGLGYIPGSVMTGDMKWFWIGGAMVLAGIVLAAWAITSRRTPRRSEP